MLSIKTTIEKWPVAGSFRISRSEITEITVVVASVSRNGRQGRGECRPYARYNETAETVSRQIASLNPKLSTLNTETLQDYLPAGAARNAVDLALWDLRAQEEGRSVSSMLGLETPAPRDTAYTLSIDTPSAMAEAAKRASGYTLLKLKTGAQLAAQCAMAVTQARPDASLILDTNEALSTQQCGELQHALRGKPVIMIEQPVPADHPLPQTIGETRPVICADEALHTRRDLSMLWEAGYRAVNIKLDKAGGLTEAVMLAQAAKAHGFEIMLGCMVGTSLAMSPALLLEGFADVIDLDGALLLETDHEGGVTYRDGKIIPAPKDFWGYPR